MRPGSRRRRIVRASVCLLLVLALCAAAWPGGPEWGQPLLLPLDPTLGAQQPLRARPGSHDQALPDSPARASLAPRAPPLA